MERAATTLNTTTDPRWGRDHNEPGAGDDDRLGTRAVPQPRPRLGSRGRGLPPGPPPGGDRARRRRRPRAAARAGVHPRRQLTPSVGRTCPLSASLPTQWQIPPVLLPATVLVRTPAPSAPR